LGDSRTQTHLNIMGRARRTPLGEVGPEVEQLANRQAGSVVSSEPAAAKMGTPLRATAVEGGKNAARVESLLEELELEGGRPMGPRRDARISLGPQRAWRVTRHASHPLLCTQ